MAAKQPFIVGSPASAPPPRDAPAQMRRCLNALISTRPGHSAMRPLKLPNESTRARAGGKVPANEARSPKSASLLTNDGYRATGNKPARPVIRMALRNNAAVD
jgi:hypothetical protein